MHHLGTPCQCSQHLLLFAGSASSPFGLWVWPLLLLFAGPASGTLTFAYAWPLFLQQDELAQHLQAMLHLGCNISLVTDAPKPRSHFLQGLLHQLPAAPGGVRIDVSVQQLSLVDDPHAPLAAVSLATLLLREGVLHRPQR